MKRICLLALCGVAGLSNLTAYAKLDVTGVGVEPTCGVWSKDVDLVRNRAKKDGIPIFMVGSSSGCDYCAAFSRDVMDSSSFKAWQAQHAENTDQPYLFLYVAASMGNWLSGQPRKFAEWVGLGSLPRISCYWYENGKEIENAKENCFAGRGKSAGYYMNWFDDKFTGYSPRSEVYSGGEFSPVTYTVTNAVTDEVVLRLVRSTEVKGSAGTNWVTRSLNGAVPVTNEVPLVWASNETAKEYTCDLDAVGLDCGVTNIYTVQLLNDAYELKSTATITALPYPYKGGVFVTSTEPHARLEADSGTQTVSVPITRTLGEKLSQRIVLSQTGRKPVTNTIEWTEGVLSTAVNVQMAGGWYVANKDVTLTLLDELGMPAGETTIACVKTVANSPSNPYWIGEKTDKTLAWGDWTMDLAAATQKVAVAEGDAYTLILVSGSKWCPDCVKTDRWLLEQSAFKDWAVRRQVSCVEIDVPRVTKDGEGKTKIEASPSLLTYESYTVSDRYVAACADGEDSRVQSGAGYLSRHGIPQSGNGGTNATAVAERNAWLFTTGTDAGGLCRPDCLDEKNSETGWFKTGVPCLIVMDKNGRIIGRNFQFNNESPSEFKAAYIDRLDELLAQAADSSEESNDSWQTTKDVLRLRDSSGDSPVTADLRKSVSYHDNHDWYRVAENAKGAKVEYRLSGDDDATVELKVVQILNGAESEISRETGSLKDGITIAVGAMPTNAFVCVSSILKGQSTTDGFFALTNAASTVAKYVLTSDAVLVPSETQQAFTATEGEESVTVAVVKGKVYRFTGEGTIDDTRLAYNLDSDVYVANASGTVVVPLETTTFTYQIWNTGNIAFEKLVGDANEPGEGYVTHTVRVKRQGGTAGIGKVCVNVDKERSTQLSGVYEFDYDGATNTWVEGATDDWELPIRILANDYADGAQKVVLVLSVVDGTAVGLGEINEYTLTIADNDSASAGKVEIASSTPAKAGSYVYAKTGSSVAITLDRVSGSDGTVSCTLAASSGNLSKTSFTWGSRDTSAQTATLSLAGIASGSRVTVTLIPSEGTKTVSSAKNLTVQVVDADAPSFLVDEKTYTVARYVDVSAAVSPILIENSTAGEQLTVTKVSGRIPGGVTAKILSGALTFTGVPTAAAGKYDAVYRVAVGSKKGLVVAVTFRVIDPVKSATETGKALNPACAKTRTFADLQVYSDQDWSRLVGLVSVTIPASGRLSAKYACASGTVALVARNWSSVSADGALTAELVGTTKKTAGYSMTVTAFADGSLTCALHDPAYKNALEVMRAGDAWSLLDDGADKWKGYYTASLAQRDAEDESILAKGDGLMTFKMTSSAAVKKGRMAYTGVLPNGKAFSGSRTLWGYYYAAEAKMVFACLPIFNVSTSDDVSGLVFFKPNAATEHKADRKSLGNVMEDYGLDYETAFVWTSKEGLKVGKVYEAEFDVYGTYYDADEDFAGCCIKTFETDVLTFFAMPKLLDATSSWSTNDTGVSAARVKGMNALTLLFPDNDQDLTLSFSRATGIVSGAMDLTVFDSPCRAAYKGIVMPGWGSASCEICSGGTGVAQRRPFVSGACWFSRIERREVGLGSKSVKLRYSCPFSIGLEAGR